MKRFFLFLLMLGCAAKQTPPTAPPQQKGAEAPAAVASPTEAQPDNPPPVREHPSLAEVVVETSLPFGLHDWIQENCDLRGETKIVAADYNEAYLKFDEKVRPIALLLGANYVEIHNTRTWPGAVFYFCRVSATK